MRYLEEEKQEAIKAKDEEAKQDIERALRKQGEKIRNLESKIKKLHDDKLWRTWAGVAVGAVVTGAAIALAAPVAATIAPEATPMLVGAGLRALTTKIGV